MRHAEHHLAGDLDAPARSRRLIERWAPEHPRKQDVVLAVSELVANAVRHAAAETRAHGLSLAFQDDAGCLRVAVSHRGDGFDATPGEDHSGLSLVDRSVDRWGVEELDHSVEVWFEIDDPNVTAPSRRPPA